MHADSQRWTLSRVATATAWIVLTLVAGLEATGQSSTPSTEVTFRDVTAELGLEFPNAAACWIDIDQDGWTDLCAAGSLWKNEAGRSFTRIADNLGASVAADFDNDGWVDLFSWSSMKLYRNDGGTGFVEVELPELPQTISRGACWGDLNGDGFVDLFIGGYESWETQTTWPLLVLVNQQGKSFQLHHTEPGGRTRGVTAGDFDRDGDLDVYTSNYRLQPNGLWVNDGSGDFRDAAAEYGAVATSPGFNGGHSIGACWGDFDSDGNLDLFAGNFAHVDNRGDQPKSRFLRNLGASGEFHLEDLGPGGIPYQESYATPAAADYDNDGNLDLFFTTVYATASFGRPNHAILFRGNGAFQMQDVTKAAALPDLPPTYQAAWADYDRDGDLDLVTAGKLWQNQGSPHRWLEINLQGDGTSVNRSAIGAEVRIRIGDRTLTRQVEAGTGEGNQNDLTLHFGLGDHTEPVKLEIRWPDGKTTFRSGVSSNQRITIESSSIEP